MSWFKDVTNSLVSIEAKLDLLFQQEHTDMAALDDLTTALNTSFTNLKAAAVTAALPPVNGN